MDGNQKQGHVVAVLIMIIALLIAGLISVLISQNIGKEKPETKKQNTQENNNKKEDTKKVVEKYEKIDESKGYYYIIKGNEYELLPEFEDLESSIISFSYPVINSKDESVKKINSEIEKIYLDKEKNVLDTQNGNCTCIKINGTKKCGRNANFYKYLVLEENNLLNIKIINNSVNNCGSGGSVLEKSYFVSKTTGKVLSNSEILKEFNYEEDKLITAYNKYVNKLKNKHKGEFDEEKTINSLDELTLIIFEEDNIIKFGISGPGYGNGSKFDLEFDGNILIGYDADEEDGILKSE